MHHRHLFNETGNGQDSTPMENQRTRGIQRGQDRTRDRILAWAQHEVDRGVRASPWPADQEGSQKYAGRTRYRHGARALRQARLRDRVTTFIQRNGDSAMDQGLSNPEGGVMRYLSLFSGMEAAGLAWKPLGWQSNRTITPLRDTDGASRMTTDTTREGFETIAFKCGLSTEQYEDGSYKSDRTENYWLFWRAAKADELAFLEGLWNRSSPDVNFWHEIEDRIAHLIRVPAWRGAQVRRRSRADRRGCEVSDAEIFARAIAALRNNGSTRIANELDGIASRPAGEAVAWLHDVVQSDGEQDQALSFSPDSFPLKGVGGFESIKSTPLFLAPQATHNKCDADFVAP